MPTKIEIINQALRHLGAQELQGTDDDRPEAARASRAWGSALDTLLRRHPWGFAQAWRTLAPVVDAPVFGFAYAYKLPVECLRLLDVRAEGDISRQQMPHEMVGRTVYTDAAPCYARMVVVQDSPASFPPDFARALSYLLAADLCPSIVRDEGTKIKLYMDLAAMALDEAMLADATESMSHPAPEDETGSYIAARR